MTTVRGLDRRDVVAAALVAGTAGVLALVGGMALGPVGLVLPVLALGGLVLVSRPLAALALLVVLVVVCESRDASLFGALEAFYTPLQAGSSGFNFRLSPFEFLSAFAVAVALVAVAARGQSLRLPGLLSLPLALLALAVAAGAVTGYGRGAGLAAIILGSPSLVFVIVLPFVVVNLIRTRRAAILALGFCVALAGVKAALGLLTVASGRGRVVDGSTITFYEPVGNMLTLVALLGVVAVVITGARKRLPWWALLAAPLMLGSLVLSYRRSFWIGLALGALLLLVLGASRFQRRLFVPLALLLVVGLWALGSVGFQAQGPLADRLESLSPSRIEVNAQDRYRIDERANVLAELRAHPITGLGLAVPWSSRERGLPVDHDGGRQYVHTVALWHWLKLGLLGLIAYAALIGAAIAMAWRTWRRDPDPLVRGVGLAGTCSLVALAMVETTGSFTGVEPRYSLVFGALLGLLAVIDGTRPEADARSAP